MAAGNFHGNFDPLTYKTFQDNVGKGNITKKLEEYMRTYNAEKSKNLDDINLEILNSRIKHLENKKTKIDLELQSKLTLKQQIEEEKVKKEQEMLEKEKNKIENSKQCINCAKILEDGNKYHSMIAGKVCHNCFMSAEKRDYEKWNLMK